MSDKGPTRLDGMGMVLLRLLRWLIWPRRDRRIEEDDWPRRRSRNAPRHKAHHPGAYRIEVDGEAGRFHGDGPPFSFWSSSRVILILSFLLWWIQPAGPMIAGYVGGRRAGSPMKAVVAAMLPIFAIYLANLSYAHNFASRQIDFVASLPTLVSDGLSSILPFLVPYKEFLVSYMTGFVQALTTTFGMGTNGYLMVVIFAYIGGLIAEQARRELLTRSGSGSSVGVNLLQPLVAARPYVDDEEEAYEDDEEIRPSRRPTRARAHGRSPLVLAGTRRRRRDRGMHFESYRRLSAETDERHRRRVVRSRNRDDEDEPDDEEGEEYVVMRTRRLPHDESEEHREHRKGARHRVSDREEDEPARSEPEIHRVQPRSQAEERAIQRFVERALRNYDHSKL